MDFIFAPIMPQTAEAAAPAAALVIPPALIYLARNPQMLNRIMNTVKSLPGLWIQIKQFAKDLEIKAQKRAEAENWTSFGRRKADSKSTSGKKPSTSTPSRSNMNSGGGSAMPPDPEKEPEKDRVKPVGENGTFWKSINTGSKQLKNQLRNYAKKSWGKGEVRTDGKHYYQFDRMHKGKPGEHLHRYYKDGKKAVPDAEIDPETGNVKRAIDGGLGEPWF